MTSFDPATHTYEINGRRVPNVTQVLGDLIPGWHAADWYLERGRAVHAAAAFIAHGIEFDADPQIEGQVRALRRFFAEVKPQVLEVEKSVFHSGYGYAGTCDMVAIFKKAAVVVDWKASISVSAPYQVAGYALALNLDHGCAVEIRDDGTYRMSPIWDLRRYKQGWLALLTAYGIRRNCGIKQEGEQ